MKRRKKSHQKGECGKKEEAEKRGKQGNRTNSVFKLMFLITVRISGTASKGEMVMKEPKEDLLGQDY